MESSPTYTRSDATEAEIDSILLPLKLAAARVFDPNVIRALVNRIAQRTDVFNHGEIDKQFQSTLGINLFKGDPHLADQLGLFVKQNVSLVTNLEGEAMKRIETSILQGVTRGSRIEDIQAELVATGDVLGSRAALIARDQVAKLNGALTQMRQTSVGITKYEWSTSNDERVRESHEENNGETFRWDSPPSETGHPGEDFQCRCVSIPILPETDENGNPIEED